MSLATWQIRAINRVAQELNHRIRTPQPNTPYGNGEVIVKFERRSDGGITMQVLDTKTVEILKSPDTAAQPAGLGDLDRKIDPL